MLTHPTLEKLRAMRLTGMAAALEEQLNSPDTHDLDFEERLGLLVDREMTVRHNRRLHTRLKQAHFHQPAAWEDVDLKSARGLDKALMLQLAACQWIDRHLNCLICGPTGVGKSYIASALAHKACREGYTARYVRLARLIQTLHIAKGDGSYPKLLKQLARFDVLVIDDGCGSFETTPGIQRSDSLSRYFGCLVHWSRVPFYTACLSSRGIGGPG
jgi:DNA replication protein DnaC